MHKTIIIALFTLCLATIFTPEKCMAEDQALAELADKITGEFDGKIHDSRSGVPVTTSFHKDGEGNLSGGYKIKNPGKSYSGQLEDIELEEGNILKCTWRDKHGWGKLKIEFSEDFKEFKGYWRPKTGTSRYKWTGERVD